MSKHARSSTHRRHHRRRNSPYAVYGVSLGVAAVFVMVTLMAALGWSALWAYLVAVNACTFVVYGWDKAVAGTGALRCPEWVLHGAALAGGTPGAMAAQRFFHHKTRKGGFQLITVAIVVTQVVLIIGLR